MQNDRENEIEFIELSVKRFDCKMIEDALHSDMHVIESCTVANNQNRKTETENGI